MRIYLYCSVFLGVSAAVAAAQEQTKNSQGPCVEVQIGQDTASRLNCLNSQLQHSVEQQAKTAPVQAPLTAQSASNKIGTFNDAAAREKMGNAYGVSATPQRPKPVFVSPLVPSTTR